MFKKLHQKWGVSGIKFVLIIAIFAIGGSLTGWAGKLIMAATRLPHHFWYYALYIIMVTVMWPFIILIISLPFGQFVFFKKYILKLGQKLFGRPTAKKEHGWNVAIFASGAGSNAQKIIEHFKNHPTIKIGLVVSNKKSAGVLAIAKNYDIPTFVLEKEQFLMGDAYVKQLQDFDIGFIALAGFLLKIPPALVRAYPNKIINIHPALLPKYGGKGMYGMHVHQAVIKAKELESGITIHLVDDLYDHGQILFQATCPVLTTDTADTLANRVLALEHQHYPAVLASCILKLK